MTIKFKPGGEVQRQFMLDNSFVRGIRGPIGSGKSVTCCVEVFRRACEQEPDNKGRRRTRWAVIRNTFPELKDTSIKTWLDWFPEDTFGPMSWTPPFRHHIGGKKPFPLSDGTFLDLEVIFLALDRDEDVKKLLSLELTGVFLNEARELKKTIVDGATSRVGRYPPVKDGIPPTWKGVIMDTNSMPEDHWWPIMSGESPPPEWMSDDDKMMLVTPDNWKFFTQPPAMTDKLDANGKLVGYELNPLRENAMYLDPDYYNNLIRGKAREWIKVYVKNMVGSITEGKVVYPEFREEVHVARSVPSVIKGKPVYVGVDFGLTPAAIFGQIVNGRVIIHSELTSQDMGAKRFAEAMKMHMADKYPETTDFRIIGDPAGDGRAQTDEYTPFMIFKAAGLNAVPASSNDPVLRTEAVKSALNTMIDGQAGFMLSPSCIVLKAGFMRGYKYKKIQVRGMDRHAESPDKNQYSHPHDALQYLVLGMGLGRALISTQGQSQPTVARRSGNLWSRREQVTPKRQSMLGRTL